MQALRETDALQGGYTEAVVENGFGTLRQCKAFSKPVRIIMHFVSSEQEFVRRAVAHIRATALPGETPNARLQLIAVAVVVATLEKSGGPVTIHMLAGVLGLTPSRMGKLVLRLVERGLVERERIRNRVGSGYAYAIQVRAPAQIGAQRVFE